MTTAVIAMIAGGCAKEEAPLSANSTIVHSTEKAMIRGLMSTPSVGDKNAGRNGKAVKGSKNKPAPVYLDGKQIAALRFGELPPTLKVHWFPIDDEYVARRFTIVEYLSAVGVDVSKIKSIQLHGKRTRSTVLSGDDLRAKASDLHFQFTHDTRGRPWFRYVGKVNATSVIDKINAISLYVDLEVPEYRHGKFYIDGELQKGLPYVGNSKRGNRATRVYVDGKMVATVKRRELKDGAKDMASVLRQVGVDVAKVTRAHLVSRDRTVLQVSGAKFRPETMTLKQNDRGRLAVEGVSNDAAIEAIVLFTNTKPVDRTGPPPAALEMPNPQPVVDHNSHPPTKKGS